MAYLTRFDSYHDFFGTAMFQGRRKAFLKAEAKDLEQQAKLDLVEVEERRKQQGIKVQSPLVVSRSNILYAWILKHSHAHLHSEQWSSPVTISNARVKPPTGMKARSDDFSSNDWYGASIVVALPSLKVRELMAM